MNIEPEDFIPDGVTFRTKGHYAAYYVTGPLGVIRFKGPMREGVNGGIFADGPAEYTTHSQKEVEFLMGHPNIEMA